MMGTKTTKTTGHTPGPWTPVRNQSGNAAMWEVRDAEGILVSGCMPEWRHDGPDAVRANARLIAAAPDMLALLQGFREACLNGDSAHLRSLHMTNRALLARVEGNNEYV